MSVAVIIVNYGTAELAAGAVESVLDQSSGSNGLNIETHLVDNASPGGDAAQLTQIIAERGWQDHVTLWSETENHGFGEGNNVVLRALASREMPPDFVFLLNPDAAIKNNAIASLVASLLAAPTAAAAGAALTGSDGAPAVAAFRFPGVVSELMRIIDFGPLKRLLNRFRVSLPATQPQTIPVDWVSGAAVMFRFRAIKDAGFFDPTFFLYYEEVDLMRRLAAHNWTVLHVPEALVFHHAGVSTGVDRGDAERQRNPAYLYHSWRHYFSKAFGRRRTLLLGFVLFPAAVLNVVLNGLRGRAPSLPRHFFGDHWKYAVRPLMRAGEEK